MAQAQPISHALVLPDADFLTWYRAAEAYTRAFDRVAVIRSPAGNDLNRFRNVSAVQAPGVWVGNDPLAHIRRVYPMVVRVDVIRAATPDQMARLLAERISRQDRFGEYLKDDHINDRFTLEWMSEARPARITLPFDAPFNGRKHEGIDIYAPLGTPIRAGAAGTVQTVFRQQHPFYGQYVQVTTRISGQTFITTYALIGDIRVNVGQAVKVGDILGRSASDAAKIIVQQPGRGLLGYPLPNIVDPIPLIYWQNIRLRTTVSSLRIRERPGTTFKVIGTLTAFDRIETLEPHGRTLAKVTLPDQWIKVRSPSAVEGFAAAEFLIADESEQSGALNLTGMNLDVMHPLGRPDAARLRGLGWVRFTYNVSMGRGSTDLNAAYNVIAPHIERYQRAGLRVILVLTHQTYGEGQGFVWTQMNTDKWRQLTARYADFARQIAGRFVGRDLIYQVWNEQDTAAPGGASSVPMPAGDYGYLLAETIKAIRAADTRATVITGGHISGPASGAAYLRAALKALPANLRLDGAACHPYGRGVPGSKYAPFGSIDDEIDAYSAILPGAKVWITEWGVLDRPNDPADDVADYATGFIQRVKRLYLGKTAAACWYAWADGMHNGYGLVDASDKPKQPLYDRYLRA